MQVSPISIDRANFSDHFDMGIVVLTMRSAIVTSRKRKLRELFAVASVVDGVPNYNFKDPDAPPTTPAESQFLIDCDILQYVLATTSEPAAMHSRRVMPI